MDPIGPYPSHFHRFKGTLERVFASHWCKKLLCWSEFTKKTVTASLNCSRFMHKIEVVPRAVAPSRVSRSPRRDGKVRLLFLGSANMAGEFEARGGREVVEAFLLLADRYPNLELTIRSEVPAEVRGRIQGRKDVQLIEHVLPKDELIRLFMTHDIFLFPGYYSAWLVILEAMSYGLPVIATDIHSTAEYVIEGRTGFLVSPPGKLLRLSARNGGLPVAGFTNNLRKVLDSADATVIEQLVKKAVTLIENIELREQLGMAARRQVEEGEFSLQRRNRVLKKILDEATEGNRFV
jgi:glycosyltransferase involved in cell wall biosynthesis